MFFSRANFFTDFYNKAFKKNNKSGVIFVFNKNTKQTIAEKNFKILKVTFRKRFIGDQIIDNVIKPITYLLEAHIHKLLIHEQNEKSKNLFFSF